MKKEKKEHLRLKDLPSALLPFEKYRAYGVKSLSDDELVALILRTGTRNLRVTEVARNVISLCEKYGGLSCIDRIPDDELMAIEGLGAVKIAVLKGVAELAKRIFVSTVPDPFGQVLNSAELAGRYLVSQMGGLEHEEIWALYVDSRNVLIKRSILASGTVNATIVSARDIFLEALRCSAVGVILAHNHPSGDPAPSTEDIETTAVIREASLLMDVKLVDHIVVGSDGYISMKECGMIPD